jgi:ABC-2 type transport system permease protein
VGERDSLARLAGSSASGRRAAPPACLSRSARFAAYRELGRIQFWTLLAYRADFVAGVGVLLLQIFLFRVVWTSVYADRPEIQGGGGAGSISLSVQIAYATLAALQFWLFNPWANQLARRVYDGKIAIDLSRPVGLIQQVVSGQVGVTLALLPFAIVALPFAVLVGGAAPPASLAALGGYALATVLAYVVNVLLTTLVGMMAFWTLEISGPSAIYRLVAQVLSGAIAPLWFMPDWLRLTAQALPFQATTYTPVAIYLGKLHGGALWTALATQLLWAGILWLLLRLVWSRALHRVVVQGG